LKLLHGNPGRRPIHLELEPEPLAAVPEPPGYLDDHACEEWRRIGPQLRALGLLCELDLPLFAVYAAAFSRWRTVLEILQREQISETSEQGKPLAKIRKDAAEEILRLAAQFGMTPAARTRLTGGLGPAKPSKFSGLIA
jgi:P27 family predicted phage terminase small subunit